MSIVNRNCFRVSVSTQKNRHFTWKAAANDLYEKDVVLGK